VYLPLRPSETDRRRAVDALKRGYVSGRLSTETFEARLTVAQTTPFRADLRALLADVSARWWTAHTLLGTRRATNGTAMPWAVLMLSRCEREEVLVGRSRGCDVVLPTDAVSRRHAAFARTGETWHVTDLGSTNGTYVDDVRVDRAPVERGARVRLGDAYLDVA
jgi:FHA domain/Domain of unknown function (DUF1707)